jgi:hypothetical protein
MDVSITSGVTFTVVSILVVTDSVFLLFSLQPVTDATANKVTAAITSSAGLIVWIIILDKFFVIRLQKLFYISKLNEKNKWMRF